MMERGVRVIAAMRLQQKKHQVVFGGWVNWVNRVNWSQRGDWPLVRTIVGPGTCTCPEPHLTRA